MTKNVLINWWIVQDASEPWQTGLQDMATAVGEEINNFHDRVLFYIFVIAIAVLWVIMEIIKEYSGRKISHKYANHGTTLEIIWTITPALILITIAFPSFRLLYLLDEVIDPAITVKVIGHQWYWSYEYSDYGGENVETISYDSYMIPTEDLNTGDLRLLEVDNSVVLPVNTHIRVIITSADVIHSWAMPSLGVKVDAVPGRLNAASFLLKRDGVFYGQCSEICGAQHGFMPIVVESVALADYTGWIEAQFE